MICPSSALNRYTLTSLLYSLGSNHYSEHCGRYIGSLASSPDLGGGQGFTSVPLFRFSLEWSVLVARSVLVLTQMSTQRARTCRQPGYGWRKVHGVRRMYDGACYVHPLQKLSVQLIGCNHAENAAARGSSTSSHQIRPPSVSKRSVKSSSQLSSQLHQPTPTN